MVESCDAADLPELVDAVDAYLLEEQRQKGSRLDFWEAASKVARAELTYRQSHDTTQAPVHRSVKEDVTKLLEGKTGLHLSSLRDEIAKGLQEGQVM